MRLGLDLRCLGTMQRFRGIGTVARQLLDGLYRDPQGEDLVLLQFRDQEVSHPDLQVVRLGPAPRNFRDGAWLLDKVRVPLSAWRERLDLLHIVAPMELFYGYHVWRGMPPVVVTAYDVIPALYPEWSFPVHAWFTRRLYRHYVDLMKRADRILSISRTTADDLVRLFGFPAARMEVVPLGVQPQYLPAASPAALETDLQGLGLHRPYLLHVGGDSPHKNIPAVIGATRALLDRGHRLSLALAGRYDTPALRPLLEDLRRRHGEDSVRVLGFLSAEDLVKVYQGAEAFVFPSFYEGFGLPPLEAMACGTPVVVSGTPALVEFGGPAARVVRDPQPEALAEALAGILGEPALRTELSARGLEWAQGFTWQRFVRETRAAWRDVAKA